MSFHSPRSDPFNLSHPTTVQTSLFAGAQIARFDTTGRFIAAGRAIGSAEIWDLETRAPIRWLDGHVRGVTSIEYVPLFWWLVFRQLIFLTQLVSELPICLDFVQGLECTGLGPRLCLWSPTATLHNSLWCSGYLSIIPPQKQVGCSALADMFLQTYLSPYQPNCPSIAFDRWSIPLWFEENGALADWVGRAYGREWRWTGTVDAYEVCSPVLTPWYRPPWLS